MSGALKKAAVFSIVIGSILIAAGVFIPAPGGALTTLSGIDGMSTEYYEFDNRYSVIDEYVGGDAYNYIIGACLVAGKMAGFIAGKAIFIACGTLCLCGGISMTIISYGVQSKREIKQSRNSQPRHQLTSEPDYYSPEEAYDTGE